MAKEKKVSFFSRKRVLSKPDYKEYKEQKKVLSRHRYAEEIKANRQPVENINRQNRYEQTRTGKFAGRFTKAVQAVQAPNRFLYRKSILPRTTVTGMSTGKKGRPKGTIDVRYRNYGGVYGFRKAQSQRNFLQRQQVLRQNTINPQQAQVLNQFAQQQQAQQQNPEGRVFPSTNGNVFLGNLMSEIDNATHLVD